MQKIKHRMGKASKLVRPANYTYRHDRKGLIKNFFSAKNLSIMVSAFYVLIVIFQLIPNSATAGGSDLHLTLRDYIWENDNEDQSNGDSVDENSPLAAGSTALTSVKKGERLTLRTHIDNSGSGTLAASDELALFYDRNDGLWSKVQSGASVNTAGGSCSNTDFECIKLDITDDVGNASDVGINPANGLPTVVYKEQTGGEVNYAHYVGAGGSGCNDASWTCEQVFATGSIGNNTLHQAIDSDGTAWLIFMSDSDVWTAEHVGSGGSGCVSNAWTCTEVIDGSNNLSNGDIAIDSSGDPWIVFNEETDDDVWVAHHVGSGGDCDTILTGGSDAWECTEIYTSGTGGFRSAIAINNAGDPWVTFRDNGADIWAGMHVGSGGTGCADGAWDCEQIANEVGSQSFNIEIAPDDDPWVSYTLTAGDLMGLEYVGSGGDCDTVKSGSDSWDCHIIEDGDNVNTNNGGSTISFGPDGNPVIVYERGSTSADIYTAQLVGAGGVGCNDSAWNCVAIQNETDDLGEGASIAHDALGRQIISFHNTADMDLELAWLNRAGEVTISPGLAGEEGDSLAESHADMTSATDTTNRDDADCIGTGGTPAWTNGGWFDTENASGLTLSAGNTNLQCTEVAWTIDTSQAIEGETYRFVVASNDSLALAKGPWRGPVAVTEFPTLTIESETTQRYAKDNLLTIADCTNTDWGCSDIEASGGNGGNYYPSLVFGSDGNPWGAMAEYNFSGTNSDILHIEYVGSSGSCTDTAWDCTTIDTVNGHTWKIGAGESADGTQWVAYGGTDGVFVAEYVGTGGTGCNTTAWDCTNIDSAVDALFVHLAISSVTGYPVIAFVDNVPASDDLKYAEYVGTGGTGCDSTAWNCETIHDGNINNGVDIAIDENGKVFVAYGDANSQAASYAEYVGVGGDCSGNARWECHDVDTSGTLTGQKIEIALNSQGEPWLAYESDDDLKAASYVGGSGSCSDTNFDCVDVMTSTASEFYGLAQDIGFDSNDDAWIAITHRNGSFSYQSLDIAKYVGSGGSGCASATFDCTEVEGTSVEAHATALAFDHSGAPWLMYGTVVSFTPQTTIAKMHLPPNQLGADTVSSPLNNNARTGDARYRFDDGRSPRTDSVGDCDTSTLSAEGYCGVATLDGQFETIEAIADETAYFTFAQKFDVNTEVPAILWQGESTQAPSTSGTNSDIVVEIYRDGTTDAWEEIGRNDTSTDCDGTLCSVGGVAQGTISEYYTADGLDYWVDFRVYQEANGTSAQTLKTDMISAGGLSQLDLKGYIWENDDKDQSASDSTQLAAGDTALDLVPAGQRLNLRTQIENTGAAFGSELALFYDRNDGLWTRVNESGSPETGTGACSDTEWQCTKVNHNQGNDGLAIAINPATGGPVIAQRENTGFQLDVATFVGSGGIGCDTGVTDWSCSTVDTSDGEHPDITITDTGKIWISYYGSGDDLTVAELVGSGGTGCAISEWNCETIESFTGNGAGGGIDTDQNGNPVIAYRDPDTSDFKVARYVGSGGTGCDTAGADWDCDAVETTASVTSDVDIVVDSFGTIRGYFIDDTNFDLVEARYVGSGGTGCDSSAWTCEVIADEATGNVPNDPRAAIGPDGFPWVTYDDGRGSDLMVARYVGSGGDCDTVVTGGSGGSSDAWDCDEVLTSATVNKSHISFAPDGTAWVAYNDENDHDVGLARYVGTGGSGCAISAWDGCGDIAAETDQLASDLGLVFDPNGSAWIAYKDDTNNELDVARLKRKNEISLIDTFSQNFDAVLSESHVDMTTLTDTTNRDDADCVTGAADWNNGRYASGATVDVALPAGSVEIQCTEINWTIDTSQASPGTTYRFMVASADSTQPDVNYWRGPASITEYPQISVTQAVASRIAKGSTWVPSGSCDASGWNCDTIISTNDVGEWPSIGIHPDTGDPWIPYFDDTSNDLEIARYVGAGNGTGCAIDEFTCESIETTGDVGGESEMVFDNNGTPWIVYGDNTDDEVHVAHYVGDGSGTGCATSDWTCENVIDNSIPDYSFSTSVDIEIHPITGQPWVLSSDDNSTYIAVRMEDGQGMGCNDPDWSCVQIVDNIGHAGLTFSSEGKAVITGKDGGNDLALAEYVGAGGDCLSDAWECTLDIDSDVGGDILAFSSKAAFDPDGDLWVANPHWNLTPSSGSMEVVEYVGDGSGSCTNTDWDCTEVDDSGTGSETNIAFDSNGTQHLFYSSQDVGYKHAVYVGSGGNCTSSAWDCVTIDSVVSGVSSGSGIIDENDVAWAVWYDPDNGDLRIANNALSIAPLSEDQITNAGRHNVNSGGDAQYRLDPGSHPQTPNVTCSATVNYEGFCALRSNDGQYDSLNVREGERPLYTFAMRLESNTELPTIAWTGRTDLAPSASGDDGDLHLEVYRFGTTNAWEALASDSSASNCDTQDCTISGQPAGTPSEYFESEGGGYWVHIRVYQIESPTSSIDFRVDSFDAYSSGGLLRHGRSFDNEVRSPFRW